MLRAEAAIFASSKPVSRETPARLVGDACRLGALLADIKEELKGHPYEIIFIAGGYRFRTRPRCRDASRAGRDKFCGRKIDERRRIEPPHLTLRRERHLFSCFSLP
jgi:hypothetical protein